MRPSPSPMARCGPLWFPCLVNHPSTAGAPYLRIERLRKQFGAFAALKDISLEIFPRRVRLLSRALGLRQDHAAAGHRRARHPDVGPDLPGGQGDFQSAGIAPRFRHRVPVVCAVSEPDGRGERRLRPRQPATPQGRDRDARDRFAATRRLARVGPQVPGAAFRRPAAARGAGACARPFARPSVAGRAAVGARRPRACVSAHRDPAPARAHRGHDDHGHARPGGSADDGRSHRGDERRRHRAGRLADGGLPEAGKRVRRRFRRHHQFPAGGRRPSRRRALRLDRPRLRPRHQAGARQ